MNMKNRGDNMDKDLETIKEYMISEPVSTFITKWILESTPYIFKDKDAEYIRWRELIADKLKIDPCNIYITGSASLGFSLNPNKSLKPFDNESDVDVSIVSNHFFDVAWYDLLHENRSNLSWKMKNAIDDHRNRLIYWGTIATDKILPLLSFGAERDKIIQESRIYDFLENRDINFRIYKDTSAIRNYLTSSVNSCKNYLLEEITK